MVCLAPRAREYSVRPRRSSGASVRPLNLTVRPMRKAAFVVGIALCYGVATLGLTTEPAQLAPSIGGIAIGDAQNRVERRLGKPHRVVLTGDAMNPELQYPGLTVWIWKGASVAQVRSTSASFCVAKTLCPGSPARVVGEMLGTPQGRAAVGEGINSYPVSAATCWLEVTVQRNAVSALEIKCQP